MEILSVAELAFIQKNIDTNLPKLLFSAEFQKLQRPHFIAEQIAGRQKIKQKLPLWYQNLNLLLPPSINLEQCSAQLCAQYKAQLMHGLQFIDITGGFGVDFHFCAAQFTTATYLEQNVDLQQIAAHNSSILGQKNCKYIIADALIFLKNKQNYAWLLADPARRDTHGHKTSLWEQCHPNMAQHIEFLLSKAQNILIKASPMLDISLAIKQLPAQCISVHVLSIQNEVKELLFHVVAGQNNSNYTITAAELGKNNPFKHTFTPEAENKSILAIGPVQKYIYEPAAALLKAGAFKHIAATFGLAKLQQHTHLYTGPSLLPNFPGRAFEVVAEIPIDNKKLQAIIGSPKAELTVRNLPLKTEALRCKLGLKEGGEYHIFGCTNYLNEKVLIISKKNK
jgi:hypothetical protein